MRTGIVSNSTLCLPLLHHLQAAKQDFVVYSAEQAVHDKGPVASFCAGAGIACTHEQSNGVSLYNWVAQTRPNIVFVIGYSQVIRMHRFTGGMPELYNVHFGHLPEYRGPNPVFWQLKQGAPSLAITIHCISEQLDAGAIAWKKEYRNEPFFSYGYVHQLMSHYLVEGVHYLMQQKKQGAIPVASQDENKAAYFGRPGASEVCICWDTMSAATICDLIKACNPWNNGAITSFNGFEVRITDAEPVTTGNNAAAAAGTILNTSATFLVSCIDNGSLHIHMLFVNGVLMPGRFAANYGFIRGQSFSNVRKLQEI